MRSGSIRSASSAKDEYVLRVRLTGFKEFVAQNIQLAAQDLRRIDVLLEIGAMETTVEVVAGATLIETETARISDSKDALAMKVLPLNTRQLWDYLSLTPGVVQAGAGLGDAPIRRQPRQSVRRVDRRHHRQQRH